MFKHTNYSITLVLNSCLPFYHVTNAAFNILTHTVVNNLSVEELKSFLNIINHEGVYVLPFSGTWLINKR